MDLAPNEQGKEVIKKLNIFKSYSLKSINNRNVARLSSLQTLPHEDWTFTFLQSDICGADVFTNEEHEKVSQLLQTLDASVISVPENYNLISKIHIFDQELVEDHR